MKNIHQQEEALQAEWLREAERFGDADELCADGLLFRGEISNRDGYWHRERGDEEGTWNAAPRRLLILTKDLNDDEAWDIRQETGRKNTIAFNYEQTLPFYKNLRMWSYLLLTATTDYVPSFREARDMKVTGPFYEQAPIARINCKKQVGNGSLADSALLKYMHDYAPLLSRQIALYDANLLLCCGCSAGTNRILDFVRAQYLPDLQYLPECEDWIYHSPSTGKIAINCYHPSARISYEDTYERLAYAYQKFLTTQK